MANLVKVNKIITQTTQGEITVNLNITLKIDSDGRISISNEDLITPKKAFSKLHNTIEDDEDNDKVSLEIPDFDNVDVNFGTNV